MSSSSHLPVSVRRDSALCLLLMGSAIVLPIWIGFMGRLALADTLPDSASEGSVEARPGVESPGPS